MRTSALHPCLTWCSDGEGRACVHMAGLHVPESGHQPYTHVIVSAIVSDDIRQYNGFNYCIWVESVPMRIWSVNDPRSYFTLARIMINHPQDHSSPHVCMRSAQRNLNGKSNADIVITLVYLTPLANATVTLATPISSIILSTIALATLILSIILSTVTLHQ